MEITVILKRNFFKSCFAGMLFCLIGACVEVVFADVSPPETPVPREKAASIRALQEGFLFVLERYSMIDSTLVAQEKGRDVTTCYGIGASSILPGVGELINQDNLKGDGLLFGTFVSSETLKGLGPKETDQGSGAAAKAAELFRFLEWGLQGYAMIDAAYLAGSTDPTYDRAFWIGAASFAPGAGQFINHDWWKGGGLFLGALALDRLAASFESQARTDKVAGRRPGPKEAWHYALAPQVGGFLVSATGHF